MRVDGCDWSWMADALDDERLDDTERAAFQRHTLGCDACRRAAAGVARLRAAMLSIPEPPLSDFEHRSQRRRLMARVAGPAPWASPGRGWRRATVGVALAALAAAIAFHELPAHVPPPVAVAVPPVPPRYEVTALADAAWSNQESGATARVTLSRGSAAFHVHHLAVGQRFLVVLPDGEIEVRGTRFVVALERGHTDYVVVIEGKVALRRAGVPERLLNAGERWDAATGTRSQGGGEPDGVRPAAAVAVAVAAPATAAEARRGPPRARHPRAGAPGVATPAAIEAPPPPAPASTPLAPGVAEARGAPSDLFARGVRAFRAGRYDEADGLWRRFLDERPHDPRVEDAAFLRAVGRARLGDTRTAATYARAYLEQFPHGMRRREAETLAGARP